MLLILSEMSDFKYFLNLLRLAFQSLLYYPIAPPIAAETKLPQLPPRPVMGGDFFRGIFDCPECGFPAEVVGIISHITGPEEQNYYVMSCLGDHDTVSVTEDWFTVNHGVKLDEER